MTNTRQIRALYDDNTITVYQAYNSYIAKSSVLNQTFISPPFKKERMTWIKPSFLWMMYRSGWATKENQQHILSIKIKREGFEWALQNSCLAHFDKILHTSYEDWKNQLNNSPVRIQWDPEKDILLQPLPSRSIQIGLSGLAIEKYVSDWILKINDVTEMCKKINELVIAGNINLAKSLLPVEKVYPLPSNLALKIRSS